MLRPSGDSPQELIPALLRTRSRPLQFTEPGSLNVQSLLSAKVRVVDEAQKPTSRVPLAGITGNPALRKGTAPS